MTNNSGTLYTGVTNNLERRTGAGEADQELAATKEARSDRGAEPTMEGLDGVTSEREVCGVLIRFLVLLRKDSE
jgi:hypothetical protein